MEDNAIPILESQEENKLEETNDIEEIEGLETKKKEDELYEIEDDTCLDTQVDDFSNPTSNLK